MQRNDVINKEKNIIEWKKTGDFSKRYNVGYSDLNQHVTYDSIKENKEIIFQILGFRTETIKIIFISEKFIDSFLKECKEHKLFTEDAFYFDECKGTVSLQVKYYQNRQEQRLLAKFLACIDAILPLGRVKKEIFSTLNLEKISDEKCFYEKLEKLIDDGNLEKVIKEARLTNNDHIFWRLGQYCENKKKFNEAICIYQEISEDNIYYHSANQKAFYIFMQYFNYLDLVGEKLTDQEKKQYQENQFRFMLRGNKLFDQEIIDQYYHHLCGGNDLKPIIKEVGYNEDTLVSLSNQVAMLRKENNVLQSKIVSLKQQLEKSKYNVVTYSNTLFNSLKTDKKESSFSKFDPITHGELGCQSYHRKR